jgi:hypothetical protein
MEARDFFIEEYGEQMLKDISEVIYENKKHKIKLVAEFKKSSFQRVYIFSVDICDTLMFVKVNDCDETGTAVVDWCYDVNQFDLEQEVPVAVVLPEGNSLYGSRVFRDMWGRLRDLSRIVAYDEYYGTASRLKELAESIGINSKLKVDYMSERELETFEKKWCLK